MTPILCNIDWENMFVPDTPLLEIFFRGTIMYLSIYFLLRFVLKRQAGSLGIADVLSWCLSRMPRRMRWRMTIILSQMGCSLSPPSCSGALRSTGSVIVFPASSASFTRAH